MVSARRDTWFQNKKSKNAPKEVEKSYRCISVYPTEKDIYKSTRELLTVIPSKGGFKSGAEYLSTQFYLLREDLISPLKNGIWEVKKNVPFKERKYRLWQLSEVSLHKREWTRKGLVHCLEFNKERTKNINWKVCKRLLSNNLICLSKDNFNSIIFGTVVFRKVEELKAGLVKVKFLNPIYSEQYFADHHNNMVVLESNVLLESYTHVLLGLKEIDEDQIPFQDYIINCNTIGLRPKYIEQSCFYDLSNVLSFPRDKVEILSDASWPEFNDTILNPSQFEAYKSALINEFIVIQGPPGTGKTFLSLEIAITLLNNKSIWNKNGDKEKRKETENVMQSSRRHHFVGHTKKVIKKEKTSPLVVVSFTNHALDQFVEGLVKRGFGNHLIRIGGKVTENLRKYSLFEQRKELKSVRYHLSAFSKKRQELMNSTTLFEDKDHFNKVVLKGGYVNDTDYYSLMKESHFYTFAKRNTACHALNVSVFCVYLKLVEIQDIDVMCLVTGPKEDLEDAEIEGNFEQNAENIPKHPVITTSGKQKASKAVGLCERNQQSLFDIDGYEAISEDESEDEFEFFPQPKGKCDLRKVIATKKSAIPHHYNNPSDEMVENFIEVLEKTIPYSSEEADSIGDPWALSLDERLKLYKYWLEMLSQRKTTELEQKIQEFENECRKSQEYDRFIDKEIIKGKDVIAMTTTGAAKNRHILKEINPKICIVEEAAEVLESHVLTSLASSTQHLIMTGDHRQLRPKPAESKLAVHYNLDLSLFERMVNNGIKCYTLNTQHRMRPEISKLMKHIYPTLDDGDKVKTYNPVKGVTKSLFFINHTEKESNEDGTKSKSNQYEVNYLVELCRYLLKQGYKNEQITILTGYVGQVLLFKKNMPVEEFKGVRVTSIDNFQGEENDIVLVSLVRSNDDSNLGFMKNENRVCVTLSRAKIGMFVMGNIEMFASSTSENDIWEKIVADVKEMECFGNILKLCCQNHHEIVTEILKPEDFCKVRDGGCNKPCDTRLKCGHTCTRNCHIVDSDHVKFVCKKKCDKGVCRQNLHPESICRKDCHDEEEIPCMKCLQYVPAQLRCGHVQKVLCLDLTDLARIICEHKCERELSCGHICSGKCGKKCDNYRCMVLVEKELPCGHDILMPCSKSVSDVTCTIKCDAILKCGHKCSGSCGQCFHGRLHVRCEVKCGRRLVCSHICQEACTEECPPCQEKCEVKCDHNRCKKRCGEECDPCRERCRWECRHIKRCTKECYQLCDRERCNKPCIKKLKCGHPCIGMCGERCPNLCRICNKEEVQSILFGNEDEPDARFIMLKECKHIIEVEALDRWMDTSVEDGSIKFKECPKCKTIIRSSRRYGNQIRQIERDINKTKSIIRGEGHKKLIEKKQQELLKICVEMSSNFSNVVRGIEFTEDLKSHKWFHCYQKHHRLKRVKGDRLDIAFLRRASSVFSVTQMDHILIQVKCLRSLLKIILDGCEDGCDILEMDEIARKQFRAFVDFITKDQWLSKQYLKDVKSELERFELFTNVSVTHGYLKSLDSKEDDVQKDLLETEMILETLRKGIKLEDASDKSIKITEIRKKHKMKPLTKEDKDMIVKAMGDVRRGGWYKCPNGHIYAIGNCGGAMQKSKCPECKAVIGGANHRLVDGNNHAGEMDGSSHSAWSEQANMGNYEF